MSGWSVCYKRWCVAEVPRPGNHQETLQGKVLFPGPHGAMERGN